MNQILDGIDSVVTAISGVLYMPWVPLLLLAAGLFFTFRSKFIQIRLLGESFRVVSEKPKTKGSISSFGALMISTASRVGTGNIAGVANAIIAAARTDMLDSTLYLVGIEYKDGSYVKNAMPCAMCKRLIINAGIQTVIVRDTETEYRVIPVAENWVVKDASMEQIGY